MKPLFNLIITTLFSIPILMSCGGTNNSPFKEGGGSSTNIISASNFGVTSSDLNPEVLEFGAGSITNPDAITAARSDLVVVWSPVDTEITVTAADNEGALVTSGTVYFETQYGILSASSCELNEGRCSVTWQSVAELSQLNVLGSPTLIDIVNVVTVWTYGAEGFIDLNGDQRLSNNTNPTTTEIFFDTDSPYLDRNDNEMYDAAVDNIIATNQYTSANNLYEGPNCDTSTRSDCGSSSLVPIYDYVYLRLNFDSSTINTLAISIDTPTTNTSFALNTSISFTATAEDPQDGIITGVGNPAGTNIEWSSSLDGAFGNNSNSFTASSLTAGDHVITATVTDSDGNTSVDTINITITP